MSWTDYYLIRFTADTIIYTIIKDTVMCVFVYVFIMDKIVKKCLLNLRFSVNVAAL